METDEAVRPCWMEIDLGALAHNVGVLRSRLGPETHIIAALKGDAYGHGIGPVAQCLARCDIHSLATGSLRDALAIREAGVELPILMFAGPLPEGMPELLAHGLTPTVHDWTSAQGVSRAATKPTSVYLKVDSGLGRLGVPLADALDFIRRLKELDHIVLEGVYTHLTFHDAAGREWARERFAAFDVFLEKLAAEGIEVPVTQALASTGLLAGVESCANAVCPGGILYGMSPVSADIAVFGSYRPVVKAIKSRIIHIGTPGAPARVGVAPIGLADGYVSHRPDSSPYALLAGRRAPVWGVSLEYLSLDLSDFPDARVGDEIVLLGRSGDSDEEILLGDIASWQGSAQHAVLMAFEGRLRARYLDTSRS
jgi:alanine racemase